MKQQIWEWTSPISACLSICLLQRELLTEEWRIEDSGECMPVFFRPCFSSAQQKSREASVMVHRGRVKVLVTQAS